MESSILQIHLWEFPLPELLTHIFQVCPLDGSRKLHREWAISGECRGRLYRFDPHSDQLDVIVSDLCAPNGVQLSKDQSKIVVVEGSANRIIILEVGSWGVLKSFQVPGEVFKLLKI